MDESNVREEIDRLNQEIADWGRVYRQIEADLACAGQEMMTRYKTKWRLERLLVPVQKCPTYRPRKRETRPTVDLEKIDLDKMSVAQLTALLSKLRNQQTEEED